MCNNHRNTLHCIMPPYMSDKLTDLLGEIIPEGTGTDDKFRAKRKELAKLDDKGSAFITQMVEKNRAKLEPMAHKAIADAEAKAKETAELANGLDLTFDL